MTTPIALSDWPRLLTLVGQALDLPAGEREAWSQGLGLPAHMQAALRDLLDEQQALQTGNFLDALPVLPGPAQAEEPAFAGQFAAGARIGPWRLLRELGRGGMSVVWLAQRADGQVERQVALKLPHAGPGQDLMARRMLRERKILAGLEHPHIARLYDVGLTDGGMPYLVMEVVHGDNLLAYADGQRLSVAQRLLLFQQVLRAVQYAHGKLVLHRDLKPSNILVTADGAVKLLDFGIAKVMAEQGDTRDETELTRTAGRLLTPSYASPEQLQGQPLGTPSDVYSLGVLVYELLCGQRPYAASAGSAAQFEAAVLNDEPQPPSRRAATAAALVARATSAPALARTLRGDLDAIVIKALATLPEDRYASADALDADVGRWLAGEPVTARPPSAWTYVSKFVRRHKLSVTLGSTAVTALLAASTVAFIQSTTARQEAARASTARDFLLQLFEEAAPDRLGGVQLTARQLLEQGREKAQARLGGQARLQAELLAGIGEAQFKVDDMVGAGAAAAKAAEVFTKTGDKAREASARLTRLQVAISEENFDTVDGLLRDLQPLLSTLRDDALLNLRWLNLQGRYAMLTGNPGSARTWFAKCIEAAAMSHAKQAAIAFDAHVGLVWILAVLGEPTAADVQLVAAEQASTAATDLPQAERIFRITEVRLESIRIARRYGTLFEALPPAIAWCEREFGRYSRKCVTLKRMQMFVLLISGRSAQALALVPDFEHELRQTSSPGRLHWNALLVAQVLAVNGKTDSELEPMVVLKKLVQPGTAHPLPLAKQMPVFMTMAEIRLRARDFPGAQHWLARAAVLMDASSGVRRTASFHHSIGRALASQSVGKDREALESLRELCAGTGGSVLTVLLRMNCVRSLVAIGDTAMAVKLVVAAVPILERDLGTVAPTTERVRQILKALEDPGGYRLPPWDPSQIFLAF